MGIVILVVMMLAGVPLGDALGGAADGITGNEGGGASTSLAEECQTGDDANQREDCRIVGVVNSAQAWWAEEFERRRLDYAQAPTTLFTAAVSTGCGRASSAVGPFYCPADRTVYIDLAFFADLRTRFGGTGGPFAQAYVIAHEYGHHVQHLLGLLDAADRRDAGPESAAVRTELQADCFAGIWAHHAVETGFVERLTPTDIADGLNAAAGGGGDR